MMFLASLAASASLLSAILQNNDSVSLMKHLLCSTFLTKRERGTLVVLWRGNRSFEIFMDSGSNTARSDYDHAPALWHVAEVKADAQEVTVRAGEAWQRVVLLADDSKANAVEVAFTLDVVKRMTRHDFAVTATKLPDGSISILFGALNNDPLDRFAVSVRDGKARLVEH